MPIDDFALYLADDALQLPGVPSAKYPKGKRYTAPAPDAETGLKITALAEVGIKAARGQLSTEEAIVQTTALMLDDESERDLYRRLLGTAWDQMIADGVSWPAIQALGKYAVLYYGTGPETAEAAMQSGALTGKGQPPNRAARRAKKAPVKKAAASKTRAPASIGGTTRGQRAG